MDLSGGRGGGGGVANITKCGDGDRNIINNQIDLSQALTVTLMATVVASLGLL